MSSLFDAEGAGANSSNLARDMQAHRPSFCVRNFRATVNDYGLWR